MTMISDMSREQNEKRKRTACGFSRREFLLIGISVGATAVLLDGSNPAMASPSATPIYAIRQNGDMLFYKHEGADDGSANWPIQARQIGNGWDFRQVFAGPNGAVYAIRQNGDMLFYKHAGFNDGSANWPIQARQIGNGWDFRQVFAGR
jgi:hypothetical protein